MKQLIGKVISTKMEKTIVVQVERKFRHPMYQKVIARHKKFKVHYEGDSIKVGDMVTIEETRPISKTKYFKVVTGEETAKPVVRKTAAPKAKPAEDKKPETKTEEKTEVKAVEAEVKVEKPKAAKPKKTTKKAALPNSK